MQHKNCTPLFDLVPRCQVSRCPVPRFQSHPPFYLSPAHTGDSPNSATVAKTRDCRQKRRLSPKSPNSATSRQCGQGLIMSEGGRLLCHGTIAQWPVQVWGGGPGPQFCSGGHAIHRPHPIL